MKARFLEDVEINDKKHGYKMVINKGDVLEVTEHENHYELKKRMDGERWLQRNVKEKYTKLLNNSHENEVEA